MGDDTWITITNRKCSRKKTPSHQPHPSPNFPQSPRRTTPSEADISTLESTIRTHRARFKSTTFSQDLTTILERALRHRTSPETEPEIDHAVCLALGSLSTENLELARRSRWQFVAFLEMCDILCRSYEVGMAGGRSSEGEAGGGMGMKMVAQDPLFSELDQRVLGRFGVEVVEGSGAEGFVTERSFLYAPFLEQGVLLGEILKGRDPLLYVGVAPGAMEWWVENRDCTGEYGDLVEEFGKRRAVTELPGDFEFGGTIFEGLSVCWRSIEDEEG